MILIMINYKLVLPYHNIYHKNYLMINKYKQILYKHQKYQTTQN